MGHLLPIAIVAALAAPVHAETDAEEPPGGPSEPAAPKSENLALGLSAMAPVAAAGAFVLGAKMDHYGAGGFQRDVGGGLMVVGTLGVFFGPSAGEWYTGKYWTTGLGLRLGGLAVLGAGAIGHALGTGVDCADLDCPAHPNTGAADVLIVAGIAMYGAGWIYDVAAAPSAARDYNATHGSLRATLVPTGNGVAVVGTF